MNLQSNTSPAPAGNVTAPPDFDFEGPAEEFDFENWASGPDEESPAVAFMRERLALSSRPKSFRPKPDLNLVQWADKYRKLSTVSSNFGGTWKTSRFEVARGPMMATTEKGVETITAEVATQTLKTELLLNIIGYHAHLDPCPIMYVGPKEDSIRIFSKERLAPMARASTALKPLHDDRVRGGKDTLFYKEFPGGFLALAFAGSPTELAMRPIRITLMDEIDKYEATKEGDPVLLGEERTATFRGNRLKVRVCSPTWEETSRIDNSYKESDQRRAYVECPHCQHWQTLDFFRNVHWPKSDDGKEHFPATAAIYCESCGIEPGTRQPIEERAWSEAQRMRMMTTAFAIRWHQTKKFKCCDLDQDPQKTRNWEWDDANQVGYACCTECNGRAVSNNHAGFQASKLYSPVTTMAELAQKWVDAKDDPEAKQVFYNTQLALTYQLQAMKRVESHALYSRREKFEAEVPEGALVITCGVDVQSGGTVNEGRLEIETVAWGADFESWSIGYDVIEGDPATPLIWAKLDAHFKRVWKDAKGRERRIEAACIDTGGHSTEHVYAYCAPRHTSNIWGIKGRSDKEGQWSPVWPAPVKYDPKKTRPGYKPISIGVNSAKEAIRELLLVDTPGPGFQHFPDDRPNNYFEQLTSEKLVLELKNGRTVKNWKIERGHANEALDTRVYAYAALRGLTVARKFNFAKRAAALEALGGMNSPSKINAAASPAKAAQTPVNPRIRRSAFMA